MQGHVVTGGMQAVGDGRAEAARAAGDEGVGVGRSSWAHQGVLAILPAL
jgi:hypothetical protein